VLQEQNVEASMEFRLANTSTSIQHPTTTRLKLHNHQQGTENPNQRFGHITSHKMHVQHYSCVLQKKHERTHSAGVHLFGIDN
jgi:hypothetical protein